MTLQIADFLRRQLVVIALGQLVNETVLYVVSTEQLAEQVSLASLHHRQILFLLICYEFEIMQIIDRQSKRGW